MSTPQITWPDRFNPATAPIHVTNQLDIAAPPEAVWSTLVAAKRWPSWYANASRVIIEGGHDDLTSGAKFRWRTFGLTLDTVVQEFAPPHRLAWLATAPGVQAYHAWLITPMPDGCRVTTEETQHGTLARLGRRLFPTRMQSWHQTWLENLATQASPPNHSAPKQGGKAKRFPPPNPPNPADDVLRFRQFMLNLRGGDRIPR